MADLPHARDSLAAQELAAVGVSSFVNNVRNQGPECLQESQESNGL